MLSLALAVMAVPVLLAAAYLAGLALLSARLPRPADAGEDLRFTVVVPAHDEAAGIARTVASLLALDWPAAQRRVCVVADNCSDDTADRARAAGATVIERHDAVLRGKGYALQLAYARVLEEGWADAVVVVDADTDVDPHLLRAFAARLHRGALAVQAYYGVRNPGASWRTRLTTLALALFHRLRGRARERLQVSSGLRGNGMCFAVEALRRVPHAAFSLVEDLEYGVALGCAGIRVHYADEASVRADMVATARAARSQRQRWEGGRIDYARRHGGPLLCEALRRRDPVLFDLALDVLVPPLAYLGLAALLLAVLGLGGGLAGAVAPAAAGMAVLPLLLLLVYLLRGVALADTGARAWLDLLAAPVYLAWKFSLLFARVPQRWVRTARDENAGR